MSTNGNTTRTERDDSDFYANMYTIIAVSAVGIIFNGLLLLVFILDPLRCLRSTCSGLIVNLCIADLLASTTVLMWSTQIWAWLPRQIIGVVFSGIWAGYTASFLTVASLSCERFIAIRYIWRAEQILTKKRTMYVLVVIWSLASVAFSNAINATKERQNIYIQALSGMLEVITIISCIFYLRIWHICRVRRQQQRQDGNGLAMAHEIRLTKIVFLLLVTLFVTTQPLMLLYQINYFVPRVCGFHCISNTVRSLPLQVYPVFALNFCLNPIFYGWRLRKYRKSFRILCCSVYGKLFSRRGMPVQCHRRSNKASISGEFSRTMPEMSTSV